MASRPLTLDERLMCKEPRRTSRPCDWCQKTFVGKSKRQRFCKTQCQEAEYLARQKARYAAMRTRLWESGTLDIECINCKQMFRPAVAVREHGAKQSAYCSKDCYNLHVSHRRKVQRQIENRRGKRALMTLACGWCKGEFKPKLHGQLPTYCSHKCNVKANTKERSEVRKVLREARQLIPAVRAPRTRSPRPCAEVDPLDMAPVLMADRQCANCAHWAGGAKGCRLEMFRACQPGVLAKFWEERC